MAFDLNAARAQRLEARGERFSFTVDGEDFSLPTELDITALDKMKALDQSDVKGVLGVLMDDPAAVERLLTHKLSLQDFKALLDAWREETGAGVGEGSPSAA
jgi:hypothetical protein